MNKNKTNKFTEDVFNSLENLKRSEPDDILFEKIIAGINNSDNNFIKENSYAGKYILVFALILIMNIFSVIKFHKNESKISNGNKNNYTKELQEFSKEYFSGADEYNYYK